ncbi:MAG TPA: HAD-IA family hydrolase [Thermoanaerobaculia bacterium]
MIRAVFFDAGATLVFPNPPVQHVYAREFSADGCAFSDEALARALESAWKAIRSQGKTDRYGGVRGETEFWKSVLNRVRAALDGGTVSDDAFARLASHFRSARSWAIFDDVGPTLERLRQRGLLTGVVSNWDSHLPRLLEDLGLSRHFDAVVVSAIEEIGKPDPEIFRRACARVGVAPAEALHVGDSLIEDFEGARAAGLQALLLDRKDEHVGVADRIRGLTELTAKVSEA